MGEWQTRTVEACLSKLRLNSSKKAQTRDYRPSGKFRIVDQGQSLIAGWTDDGAGLIDAGRPVIVFGDHTRAVKFVDFPFVRGADGTQVLNPTPDIDPLFFYYALKNIDLPSRGYNRHFKSLKEKTIRIPGEGEQTDIARSLKLVEDTARIQEQEILTLERCKRAAMQMMFSKGLRGEEQKETEIGPVPRSWDVCDFASVRKRLQYGTSTRCTYHVTPYPVLRIPNIEPGWINVDDLKFGSLRAEEAQRFRLEEGDLIFIRTNGVIERLGACAVYSSQPERALFASYLIRAQLELDRVNPHFAAYFFESDLGTSIIAGRATPAADGKYNLNTGIIDSLPIPLPSTLGEQQEIVIALKAIDAKIKLHHHKLAVFKDLFRALLHKLMSGEIRVSDLDLSSVDAAPVAELTA